MLVSRRQWKHLFRLSAVVRSEKRARERDQGGVLTNYIPDAYRVPGRRIEYRVEPRKNRSGFPEFFRHRRSLCAPQVVIETIGDNLSRARPLRACPRLP